jgi:FCP1-like phosphatase family protein
MTGTAPCSHSLVFGGLCAECGARVETRDAYCTIHGVSVSQDLATTQNEATFAHLFEERKLALILDLDKTLIDTICVPSFRDAARLAVDDDEHANDFVFFTLDQLKYLVRLRPFVREFLALLAPRYLLHISTLSRRLYALRVLEHLDPENIYFPSRLLCRDDDAGRAMQKTVASFFPADDRMVVVLDDTPVVWHPQQTRADRQFFHGLIQLEQFNFFCCPENGPPTIAPRAIRDTTLQRMAEILAQIHENYYEAPDPERHVLMTISDIKLTVLEGCYIFFTDIWREDDDAAICEFRRRTEQFGASSLVQFVPYCTHVIASSMAAMGVQEAAKYEGINLVNLRWFEQSCLHFRRADEGEPAFRIEPGAPAATTGELQRCDPPDEKDLSTGDLGDSAFATDSDDSGEYDMSMSPEDLSFLEKDETE